MAISSRGEKNLKPDFFCSSLYYFTKKNKTFINLKFLKKGDKFTNLSLNQMKINLNRIFSIYMYVRAVVSTSAENLFRCNSSEYIRNFYICDNIKDCSDGSDEIGCS